MSATPPTAASDPLGERTVRRITRRLMPFLFILYFIAYLDRVNVSFAALEMTRELNMTHEAFGFGAGIFFLGYFLLEIPGAILVETWSARKWIARIMITWGLIAAGTGLVTNANQFYTLRFLLGLAEAGFFPGMLVYLSHWYRARDRAKAIAMFMIAIPISEVIGAPVSAFLMRLEWLGMAGWRWLLILEGLPAVILGVVVFFFLTDWPREAKWLAPEERDWIAGELEKERMLHPAGHSLRVWEAFRNWRVVLLLFAYFAMMNLNYGLIMWLPKILKSTYQQSTFAATLLTGLPFLVAAPAALWMGWHSDRTQERRWHAAGPLLGSMFGLLVFRFADVGVGIMILVLSVCVAGGMCARGPFWAISTTVLTGKAAAASIGLINSFGNLGGFVGPYTVGWLATRTDGFGAGLLYLAGAAMAGALLIVAATRRARARVAEPAAATA
jgi:ACS family tartrate transporter-like MFS transporter